MGKMVHSTVHEDEHQFVVQLVFNKPEDLSRSMPPTREVRERYSVNSERSSTGSISSQSDGRLHSSWILLIQSSRRIRRRQTRAEENEETVTGSQCHEQRSGEHRWCHP